LLLVSFKAGTNAALQGFQLLQRSGLSSLQLSLAPHSSSSSFYVISSKHNCTHFLFCPAVQGALKTL
jgi:hypothetical protein